MGGRREAYRVLLSRQKHFLLKRIIEILLKFKHFLFMFFLTVIFDTLIIPDIKLLSFNNTVLLSILLIHKYK